MFGVAIRKDMMIQPGCMVGVLMSVGVITVGVMSVGVMTVGVMRRPRRSSRIREGTVVSAIFLRI